MHQPLHLVITRNGSDPPVADPAFLDLDLMTFGVDTPDAATWTMKAPTGWRVERTGPGQWRVTPEGLNPDLPQRFSLVDPDDPESRRKIEVIVSLDLRSSFDGKRHALPYRNNAEVLGRHDPRWDIFERTYSRMPARLQRLLFDGLYSDIVFLHSDGSGGGFCTGMARWAIARGKGLEPDPGPLPNAAERVAIYHGRQLRDRVLLASLGWFLRASPRAAFRAVRDDLLRSGSSDRALDIGVPKPWRRDVFRALVRVGHTVVPYRVRQEGPWRGCIEVYDPNRPEAIGSDEPRVIEFDLRRDRYSYRKLASMDQGNVGMIAVRQSAYEGDGSAIVATIGSLLLSPTRGWAVLRGENPAKHDDAQA